MEIGKKLEFEATIALHMQAGDNGLPVGAVRSLNIAHFAAEARAHGLLLATISAADQVCSMRLSHMRSSVYEDRT